VLVCCLLCVSALVRWYRGVFCAGVLDLLVVCGSGWYDDMVVLVYLGHAVLLLITTRSDPKRLHVCYTF
jgi:hypothetical protein